MFMTKLRGTKKNNRIWWIVVTVILGFGLVGSYAVWTGGGSTVAPTGTAAPNAAGQTAQQEIDSYKSSIAQVEARLKTSTDEKEKGSLNLALGNYHYDIGQKYLFDLNQAEQGISEFKAATDAYKLATDYDPKNADLRVDFATAAMYSNQLDLADEQFNEAIKIDGKHLNANFNYAIFLANAKQDYTKALQQLNTSKELAKGNQEYLDRIDQVLTAVQAEMNKPATTTDGAYGTDKTTENK